MKILLDTHIWIWLLRREESLGPRTLQTLGDTRNELWLSPVSVWEALTLHRKGRLNLPEDLDSWLQQATAATRQAPLTNEIAVASHRLDIHGDPADRLLAATAQVLDLTLVTADKHLLGLGSIRTLANR